MRVGTKEVHFNLNQSLKQHDVEQAQCMKIDSVNPVYKKLNDDLMNENSIDDYISSSLYDDDFEKEKIMAETILSLNERNTEYLNSEETIPVEEKNSEGLVLKELPKHLKYVFLEKERSKPIIIVTYLTAEKEKKVVETLRKHQEAITWLVEVLKGINPSMLDMLAGHSHYCFLDGYFGSNQIAISLEDQEKTPFICPYGTYAFKRIPFRLCNVPATFQRCMVSIFSNLVEEVMEIFIDDFSVYGSSFESCL